MGNFCLLLLFLEKSSTYINRERLTEAVSRRPNSRDAR